MDERISSVIESQASELSNEFERELRERLKREYEEKEKKFKEIIDGLMKEVEQYRQKLPEMLNEIARSRGLEQVKIIVFDLPTEYQGAVVKFVDNGKKEIREFTKDPRLFRTLRSRFYDILRECGFRTKMGWIIINDKCMDDLNKIMDQLNRLSETNRAVEILDVYIPRTFIINEAIDYVNTLRNRMNDVKIKLDDPMVSLSYKKQLLKQVDEMNDVVFRLMSLIDRLAR